MLLWTKEAGGLTHRGDIWDRVGGFGARSCPGLVLQTLTDDDLVRGTGFSISYAHSHPQIYRVTPPPLKKKKKENPVIHGFVSFLIRWHTCALDTIS